MAQLKVTMALTNRLEQVVDSRTFLKVDPPDQEVDKGGKQGEEVVKDHAPFLICVPRLVVEPFAWSSSVC